MPRVVLRAVLVWVVIIAVETVHGILRTLLLVPLVGDFPARSVGAHGVAADLRRGVGVRPVDRGGHAAPAARCGSC